MLENVDSRVDALEFDTSSYPRRMTTEIRQKIRLDEETRTV